MDQLLKSKYRIGNKLAENPFSITYQGFFIGTDRPVIIKIYRRGTLNSPLIKEHEAEGQSDFSLINHHGVAKLLDGDYGWQGFYYVREFIDGRDLQEYIAAGEKFGPDKACDIIEQVSGGAGAGRTPRGSSMARSNRPIFLSTRQGIVRLVDFVIEGEVKEALPQKVDWRSWKTPVLPPRNRWTANR